MIKKTQDIQKKVAEKIPKAINKVVKRSDIKEDLPVPRITTKNVAEHREDVLKGARKFIIPLQQTRKRIVAISVALFLVAVLIFSVSTVFVLYRQQSTSKTAYQLTKVIPYPVARIGSKFVSYENYLFELRHYIHYYENQQQLSFKSESGQDQLQNYKNRALNKVINDAYIKQIAKQKNISVSEAEVDQRIRIAREQNRLGGSD